MTALKEQKVDQLHKRVGFLHDMVAADIFSYRNVKRDAASLALAEEIKEGTGRDDGMFTVFYCQRLTYTDAMYFKWIEDAPIDYTSLEEWWNMIEEGQDPLLAYDFYIERISNPVTNQWQEAFEKAHTIWKPPQEQTVGEQDENTDPN